MITRKTYINQIVLAFGLSLILTLLLMLPALAFAHDTDPDFKDDPYRVEKFQIETPGSLEVRTSGGHISVEGSSTDEVRVEMYVRKNGRELLPEDTDLDNWEIEISQNKNTVKAIAKRKNGGNWGLFGKDRNESISFVIYTPQEMNTSLKTSGGHIDVEDISGEQKISTSGGHLNLAKLEGNIDARTSGGHVSISEVNGTLNARTSGGHIDVSDSKGDIKVKTSGGHVSLSDVGGLLEASTSGGNIKADIQSVDQLVDLRTSGGNIRIRVPKNLGFDLDLRGSYVRTDLENFSGEVDRNEVEGKINGGGARIAARTSGGVISLDFH